MSLPQDHEWRWHRCSIVGLRGRAGAGVTGIDIAPLTLWTTPGHRCRMASLAKCSIATSGITTEEIAWV